MILSDALDCELSVELLDLVRVVNLGILLFTSVCVAGAEAALGLSVSSLDDKGTTSSTKKDHTKYSNLN